VASFSDLDLDDKRRGEEDIEGGDPPTSGAGQDR